MPRLLPHMLLLSLGLMWAIRLLAIKAASANGATPIETVLVATTGIVVLLTIINFLRGDSLPLTTKHWRFYVLAGVFGFGAPFLAEILVASKLPAVLFIVIATSAPIWTVIISIVSRYEQFNKMRFTGILIGFLATVCVIFGSGTLDFDDAGHAPPIWIVVAFIIPILYAIYIFYISAGWPEQLNSLQGALGQSIVGLLAFISSWAIFSKNDADIFTLALDWSIWVIVLSEVLALILMFHLARNEGASFVAQANYVAVVAGAVIAMTFFDQRPNLLTLLGAALLVVALKLASTTKPVH